MKSRSPRLSDPSDDWGDGPWTVDCSCGVTFDDGDEMVSCDECGVWVHTRCAPSHAINARPPPPATRRPRSPSSSSSSPPKPPTPPPSPRSPTAALTSPWNSASTSRVPPTATPPSSPTPPRLQPADLEMCRLHPKKFNRQYHNCRKDSADAGGENPASKGADVLFSLSEEIVSHSSARTMLASMSSQEAVRKVEAEKASDNVERSHRSSKNERNTMRMLGANWGKRRKDESRERKKRPRDDPDRDSADTKMRGTYSDDSRQRKKRRRDDPDRDSADTKTRGTFNDEVQ